MAGNNGIAVADIINEALGHLGVYQGDPLAASDLQSAFFTFCGMVDGWAAEALTIYENAALTFSTIAGQQSYTIGVNTPQNTYNWGAPFLPTSFEAVTMTTGTLEIPLAIDTELEWAAIAIKSLQSGILNEMYPNYGAAAHILSFWPLPNAAIPVTLYVPQRIPAFTATSDTVILPPGYQEALTFELAIKCSSKFGAQVPAWLPEAWSEAKARIKAMNFAPLDAKCDPALLSRGRRTGGGSLNFYIGS